MNVFNYANPSDFEPQTEEGDLVDTTDNEVEVLDIETEDWRFESTLILRLSGCLPPLSVSVVKCLSLSTDD